MLCVKDLEDKSSAFLNCRGPGSGREHRPDKNTSKNAGISFLQLAVAECQKKQFLPYCGYWNIAPLNSWACGRLLVGVFSLILVAAV